MGQIGGIGCACGGLLAALARGLWGDPVMIDPAPLEQYTPSSAPGPGQKAVWPVPEAGLQCCERQ